MQVAEKQEWGNKAFEILKDYCKEVTLFQCEDFRAYCKERGLPLPTQLRSFASVIVRAKNAGLIFHAGYDKVDNIKAHHAMANVWRTTKN